MNPKPHVLILGAGPAGLGAACKLAERGDFRVTVLEKNRSVGGNAGSFQLAGQYVDYGSHRLHPSCEPEVMADIKRLLGDDLLDRPRHGRIRLRRRWIHFPLKPVDLALRLPPRFALGVVRDMAAKPFRNGVSPNGSFSSVLEAGLGPTICREFYFPYARKIWGLAPDALSGIQARRRVSASSTGKLVRKVVSMLPGVARKNGKGRFWYPRRGFGQISEAYCQAAVRSGADVQTNAEVQSLERTGAGWTVSYRQDGRSHTIPVDVVWSTIPVTLLMRYLRPAPPPDFLRAAGQIDYRAMILIYLVLQTARFSEYDAHYFPGAEIPITRMSEPKNYSTANEPKDRTVLCAELPCSAGDPAWSYSDEELERLLLDSLKTAGIPPQAPVLGVDTRRLRFAYPIYTSGYESFFDQIDQWISRLDRLTSFGRQGLFAHDNTHHALFMAYSAVKCLDSRARFDTNRWLNFRKIFATHVVED
ncbi:MAG: NAD(P)/FAD-dependent oxidoreductase [Acidobacteriota bacterium]